MSMGFIFRPCFEVGGVAKWRAEGFLYMENREVHHCGENRGSSLWRIKVFLSMESRGAFSNWNGHIFNSILFSM